MESRSPPARGRKRKEPNVVVQRSLEKADVEALWNLPDGGLRSVTAPLKKLRHRHHTLARLLAAGVKPGEASLITGYQLASISILQTDPAFKELLGYYTAQKEQVFIDFHERLKELGISCFQEIMDRLEDDPEQFSLEDLREFLVVAADRTGHGPSKNVALSGTVGVITSEHLLRIKEEVTKRQNGTVEKLDAKDYRFEVGNLIEQKSLAEEAQVLEPTEEGTGL
jgi:hypothetical protein